MKYKTADYLRSTILALSLESGNDGLCAAVVQRVDDGDQWEIHLFSRYDCAAEFYDFVVMAKAICGLVPSLTFYEGRYNSAPRGSQVHSSIVIW